MTTSRERPLTERPLTGRTAVVTGATSGIGAATARRLADDGARVAVLGRRADRLAAVAADIRGLPITVDVTDEAGVAGAAETIRRELGRPDLVVANAGVMLAAPFDSAQTSEWTRMIDTNISGLLWTGRAFIADLLAAAAEDRPADLVHVGSIGGHVVFPTYGVYAATKAAVAHLTRNLRAELGPRGVRVRTVEPGLTGTELGDEMVDAGARAALAEMRQQLTPIPPEDIADAIAWSAAAPTRVNVAELIVLPTRQG